MNKIKNRTNFVLDYLLKRKKLKSMPIEVNIGITNNCNAKCIMCPHRISKRKIGYMSFQTFKKIVDEVKDYVEILYLHLDGESLFHPGLAEMIKYCKQMNITAALSTNGILLDEKRARGIIEAKLDYLIVSIDAASRETYLKVRGVDKYDTVVDNLINFLKLKGNKRPYTAVQLVHSKENDKEVKEFKRFWKDKGVDSIRIKPALSYGGFFKDGVINKKIINKPCLFLWRMLNISWDGTAVLCCFDLLNNYRIGDVNKQSISGIWNSEDMMKYRDIHINKAHNQIPLCIGCNVPRISFPLLVGSILFDAFTIKKIIIKLEKILFIRRYV